MYRCFRRLIDGGTVYLDAHHGHANIETTVGHTTTLATRADPSAHGMVAIAWFDQGSDELMYNIEDSKVFGASVKDCGAVSTAGHTGKAFRFSKQLGEFVTNHYYYDNYPR